MALDQSALLEVLDALRDGDFLGVIRYAACVSHGGHGGSTYVYVSRREP
jgi:hypothetical protein